MSNVYIKVYETNKNVNYEYVNKIIQIVIQLELFNIFQNFHPKIEKIFFKPKLKRNV